MHAHVCIHTCIAHVRYATHKHTCTNNVLIHMTRTLLTRALAPHKHMQQRFSYTQISLTSCNNIPGLHISCMYACTHADHAHKHEKHREHVRAGSLTKRRRRCRDGAWPQENPEIFACHLNFVRCELATHRREAELLHLHENAVGHSRGILHVRAGQLPQPGHASAATSNSRHSMMFRPTTSFSNL